MFKNVNLQEALEKERKLLREKGAMRTLYDAFDILNDEVYKEREIRKRVFSPSFELTEPKVVLSEERVFQLHEIRNICVKYRLRFLKASKFKNELPYEAVRKIKDLEREAKQKLSAFYIVAPSDAFQLEDCDKDPMLFLSLGEEKFYLIHQWGSDMSWYRKLCSFPTRSFASLGLTIFVFSILIALFIPTSFIQQSAENQAFVARFAFFMWSFISISSVVTYVGLAFFKDVSVRQWNSPFFKQHF